MSNQKNTQRSKTFDGFMSFCKVYADIFKEAYKQSGWKKKENLCLISLFIVFSSISIYKGHHLNVVNALSQDFLFPIVSHLYKNIDIGIQIIANITLCFLVYFFFMGIRPYRINREYQKGIDRLKLKSGLDEKPKLLSINHLNENRTKLMVKSYGVGLDRYKSKLDDLRASVGQLVESVKYDEDDNSLVEIYLARKPLTKLVPFVEAEQFCKKPYHFSIGKSLPGIITQDLTELPHLMIGGTSGGGKSHTLNNVLINLLKGSKNLEMYLIDLKNGLEIKAYENLASVKLIKDASKASAVLKLLVKEMDRRYKYLESKGHKKLDPKRDKMNRIVVAIDECTDLLGKVIGKHPDKDYIEKSIQYVDTLSRKARAAGIHLILATQKIDKSSIPTRIQENMQGRIALKVGTMENSVRMLGNRKAYDIPAVKGRAIWSFGSGYTEVQVPFISEKETEEEILKVKELLDSNKIENYSFLKIEDGDDQKNEERKGKLIGGN